MEAAGKKLWVIPGGHIPLKSTGKEPRYGKSGQTCNSQHRI
jgi:hypothetical protein